MIELLRDLMHRSMVNFISFREEAVRSMKIQAWA